MRLFEWIIWISCILVASYVFTIGAVKADKDMEARINGRYSTRI